MSLLVIVVGSAVILSIAYFTYGPLLARLLQLDPKRVTPAVELRDNLDYEPLAPVSLLPQHFSAIAAAGPIVGPIMAGLMFGWLPALIWILVGSIFIGGVHDFTSLVASIRHKARTIAEVVREHMSPLSYLLFLSFIWIALVYIIVAFTDVTAAAFVGEATEERGGVSGGAIASSSIMYLVITMLFGLVMRFTKIPLWLSTTVFLVIVGAAIMGGKYVALDIDQTFDLSPTQARKVWDVALLLYCLVAAVAPVWLLLQPRGHLGGFFLYFALGAGAIGLILGGGTAKYPAFRGWEVTFAGQQQMIFPMLFITIACGACSGFHSLIASGTTSKQLRNETDAKVIGYGTMLLEAMVAIVSLCCVMMFAENARELVVNKDRSASMVYAEGIAKFLDVVGIPREVGLAFALMAFTTFVYDTLDVCTRLGRFIIQELTGMRDLRGAWLGTAITAGVPIYFLLRHPDSAPVPVYQIFWQLFGASNQLLAALTLLGVTVWLYRTRRAAWVWIVTGLPTVWMYVMSTWGLWRLTAPGFRGPDNAFRIPTDPVPWAGVVLLALAALMLLEAIRILLTLRTPRAPLPEAVPAIPTTGA
jgi:carbon starvation protein